MKRLPRFDLLEIVLMMLGVGALCFYAGRSLAGRQLQPRLISAAAGEELSQLEQRYGPSKHSEHADEWILKDFFGDRRAGVFVDVGANDYQRFSNTYYLETARGWSGLAIEPQAKFAADYTAHRPRTTFVPLFVSDESNREAVLHVPSNDLVASGDDSFARSFSGPTTPTRVNTATLDDILDRFGVTQVDFLTMDIELAEPAALKGFSIRRFNTRLACVEAHPSVRQRILDYFAANGYVVAGKYLRADDANLWFVPGPT